MFFLYVADKRDCAHACQPMSGLKGSIQIHHPPPLMFCVPSLSLSLSHKERKYLSLPPSSSPHSPNLLPTVAKRKHGPLARCAPSTRGMARQNTSVARCPGTSSSVRPAHCPTLSTTVCPPYFERGSFISLTLFRLSDLVGSLSPSHSLGSS